MMAQLLIVDVTHIVEEDKGLIQRFAEIVRSQYFRIMLLACWFADIPRHRSATV
jgi:hypothetical protein